MVSATGIIGMSPPAVSPPTNGSKAFAKARTRAKTIRDKGVFSILERANKTDSTHPIPIPTQAVNQCPPKDTRMAQAARAAANALGEFGFLALSLQLAALDLLARINQDDRNEQCGEDQGGDKGWRQRLSSDDGIWPRV